MDVQKLTDTTALLTFDQVGSSALVSFIRGSGDDNGLNPDIGLERTIQDVKIKDWGQRNNLPNQREQLLCANNIVPTLLSTKRDIIVGSGVYLYTEKVIDGKRVKEEVEPTEEQKAFLDRLKEGGHYSGDYFEMAASDYVMHANFFPEFIPSKGGKIYTINCLPAKNVRAVVGKKNGAIQKFAIKDNWDLDQRTEIKDVDEKITVLPAFDEDSFMKKAYKAIFHGGERLLRPDGYYFAPSWWAGKTWIELANAIPDFHKANLLNSYSIKYHIEIPNDYFDNTPGALIGFNTTEQDMTDDEKKLAAFDNLIQQINDFLQGYHNAGKAFFSGYDIDVATGKKFPGIVITPLKAELQDEALLKLFEKSNEANISAQAIHPTLAAINTQGKLSSGSEIRNAFLMYVAIKAPTPRKAILRPLEIAAKINGWDGIKFGIRDMELHKLSDEKSGIAEAKSNEG